MTRADHALDAAATERIVDCAVHPVVEHHGQLREYMPEPFRSRSFPGPDRYFYPTPGGEYADAALDDDGFVAASDPAVLTRAVLDGPGADLAVLVPLTRGLSPELDLGSAISAATNDWLRDVWLDSDPRLRGSIRVNPADPPAAVREIDRWAGEDTMVQVAVPLESHRPYGDRSFAPVWEAAARHRLPVCVVADGGSGVELAPTPAGYPRHFAEYRTMQPLSAIYHVTSLLLEGVFGRLPELRFVFLDGGVDVLMPLMWRLDANWRSTRHETPWVTEPPSEQLERHVRYAAQPLEGPTSPEHWDEWCAIARWDRLLLYGSHYPFWPFTAAAGAVDALPAGARRRVLADNADAFYGFEQFVTR